MIKYVEMAKNSRTLVYIISYDDVSEHCKIFSLAKDV